MDVGLSIEMEISGRAFPICYYMGPGALWWTNVLILAPPTLRLRPDTWTEFQDPVSHTAQKKQEKRKKDGKKERKKKKERERKEKKRGKRGRKEGRKGRKEGRNEGRKEDWLNIKSICHSLGFQ